MQVAKNGHSLIPPPWEVSVLLPVYLCLQIVLLHTYSNNELYDIAYIIIATLLLLGIL